MESSPAKDMRTHIRVICENNGSCLEFVGATFDDVVSATTYVLDLKEYYAVSDERFKFFSKDWPASTLVHVSALGAPEARIEITAEAVLETVRLCR